MLSPTPAGSIVKVAGPEIVSEVIRIAEPSAPVWNAVAVTIPVASTLTKEMSSSNATSIPLEAADVVTLEPPVIDRVSFRRSISSEPLSPATVKAVPTVVVVADVIRPLASTVITGIAV